MNIFDFLGMIPQDHRKENKVTQLVKHFDEVVDKHKTGKDLVAQIKKDGVCSLVVVYRGVAIFSRTGKQFTNTHHLTNHIVRMNLPDGVYMGEITCSSVSLEVLSGVVNPNRKAALTGDKALIPSQLEVNFFDLISIESFVEGASQTPYYKRYSNLLDRIPCDTDKVKVLACYPVSGEPAIDRFLKALVDQGEEGLVVRDANADWEAGHKGWRVMKKVRGIDYDLLCVGWEEGTGKYKGKVANLIFQWKDGQTIKCMLGKGWTHQDAEDMFQAITLKNGFTQPIGKIFQVYALEESSKGKLRLPKAGELRHDKTQPDV